MECNVYHPHDYGSFLRRGFADNIDAILLAISFAVVSAIAGDLSGILQIVIFLTYMIGLKASRGATLGYQFLDMKIVAINGSELTVKQIAIRVISSVFSLVPFGLGFFWILIDENNQAWHDKIAGTYVVRSSAKAARTLEIPQTSLIKTRLFISLAFVGSVLLIGFFGGVTYLIKSSHAYQLSEQYIQVNPWVRKEVGSKMTLGLSSGNVSTSGASGEANFTIYVSGDKGQITVTTVLEKTGGQWVIIEAAYTDKEGEYIDITKPYIP